ncbi:MAG TPA: metal ABC transporter substrate-binding protein [Thermoleophilaceae bacterium]|nr:metal ABC transporter substrate-binding protein [Thermoleophilaceae bacterium]
MLSLRKVHGSLTLLALAGAAALVAGGCGDDASSSSAEVTAVATTTQVGDLARAVGGDRVDVRQLLRPNSDPHGYEPRPSDAAAVADADVVLRSGGDLDEWLGDLIENVGGDAPVIDLSESVDTADDDDPHWWQDPRNAVRAVAGIEAALAEADPDGRDRYRRRAGAYVARLGRLDRDVAACIERIPPRQRRLVTTHDALGYYADRYGIEVVGAVLPSLSTAAQPSAGDTERVVDQIERQDVEAIFPESSVDPKLERAIARETGAEVGRPLWADALGPEGSDGETYVESIASNTAALVDGLTGGAVRCRPSA